MRSLPLLAALLPTAKQDDSLAPLPPRKAPSLPAQDDFLSVILQIFHDDPSKPEEKPKTPEAPKPAADDTALTSTLLGMIAQPMPVLAVPLRPASASETKQAKISLDDRPSPSAVRTTTPGPTPVKPDSESAKQESAPDAKSSQSSPPRPIAPAEIASANKPLPTAPVPITTATQPVVAKLATAPADGLVPVSPVDGTPAALTKPRMKFAAEKNEIAGRTVQKVPKTSRVADGVATATDAPVLRVNADASGPKKEFADVSATLNFSTKPVDGAALLSKGVTSAPAADPGTQVEKVAHLINEAAVSIRQSGADSLALSLKLDSHTELFLRLTRHNGQIQASVCCEHNSAPGLEGHWTDLQNSLAKQNVQLQPLSTTASASSFNAPPQTPQKQQREARQDAPPIIPMPVKTVLATAQPEIKTAPSSAQGWESWA